VWPLAAHPWFGIRACGKTLGWRLVSEHRLLLQSERLEIFVLGSGVGGKLIAASPHRRPEVQHRWDFEAERSIDHTGPTALTRMPRCCASTRCAKAVSSRAGCKNRCRSSDEYLERFITTFELTLNSNGEWRANGDLDQTVAVDALIEIACAPRRGRSPRALPRSLYSYARPTNRTRTSSECGMSTDAKSHCAICLIHPPNPEPSCCLRGVEPTLRDGTDWHRSRRNRHSSTIARKGIWGVPVSRRQTAEHAPRCSVHD
jgi:hypothetical protein